MTRSVPEQLFERSLRCFPPDFRAQHGDPMLAMFRSQWAEARGRHPIRRFVFLCLTLLDVVASGLVERFGAFRGRGLGGRGVGPLGSEVGQCVRTLARRRGYATLAVGTLAIGIGGIASIGSVAYHVLLKPLDYDSGEEIVQLWLNAKVYDARQTEYYSVDSEEIGHFEKNGHTVREMTWVSAARSEIDMELAEGVERVPVGTAAPNFFAFLGTRPALGRLDLPRDGGAFGVVLSHAEWVRRWGSDPSIVGRNLTVSGLSMPVTGVLPPDFEWIERTSARERADYWIVRTLADQPGDHRYGLLVKPRPERTLEDVRLDFARSVYGAFPADQEPRLPVTEAATAEVLRDYALGPLEPRIGFLLGAAAFVVLLGALSVSNLMLGRVAERDHEIGVRMSLGASRSDVIRIIAIEAIAISLCGAVLGILLARWGLSLIKVGAPVGIPRLASATVSPAIVLGVSLVGALIALVVLVLPARGAASTPIRGRLSRLAGRGQRRARFRSLLILTQVSIATVLLVGGSLMLRSLHAMATVQLGYDPGPVVAGQMRFPASAYWRATRALDDNGRRVVSYEVSPSLAVDRDRFRELLAALPGVAGVSFARYVPLSGAYGQWGPFVAEGGDDNPPSPRSERMSVNWNEVDEHFFDVLGVSFVEGRSFGASDFGRGAPAVAVVSDRLAARFWPGASAVGKRFELPPFMRGEGGTGNDGTTWVEIIGVVAGLRELGLDVADESFYTPLTTEEGVVGSPSRDLAFFVSTGTGDPAALVPSIRRVIREVYPATPPRHLAPLAATAADFLDGSVFYASLLSIFAAYGLVLSVVGIVGVILFQVNHRRREIALRVALGALPADVIRMIGWDTTRVAALGVGSGLVVAASLSRMIQSFLFDVTPLDPWTFAVIPALFLSAAVAAAVIPARRALAVQPGEALASD